ncbi:MAG: hypothetical protein DWQ06_09285 [Calditrichaeota bacterium]|nr:MAG: hypothetical protein DWQ06_09285 [Calditrichota bacterium]
MRNLVPNFISQKYSENNFSGTTTGIAIFIDISGFTSLTETLAKFGNEGKELLSSTLKFYFDKAIESVYQNGGFVTNFEGDAFTAFFEGEAENILPFVKHSAEEILSFFQIHNVLETKFGDFNFFAKMVVSDGTLEWLIFDNGNQKSFCFFGTTFKNCAKVFEDSEVGKITYSTDLAKTSNSLKKQQTKQLVPLKSQNIFYPKEVLNFAESGEFRKNVVTFANFKLKDKSLFKEFIEQVGSTVNKFDGFLNCVTEGDKGNTIFAFWGSPKSHENDLERAVSYLLELKIFSQKFGEIKAGLTYGISYTGFNGGTLHSDFTCLGNATNQATRFMSKASWNQILVGKSVKQNLEKNYDFEPLGEIYYKGKSEKIQTFELISKKLKVEEFQGKLIGRNKELLFIKDSLGTALKEEVNVLLYVFGDAGIGKSKLISEVKNSLVEIDFCFLQCDEILKKSLNPFTYFLKNYFLQNEKDASVMKQKNFDKIYNDLIEQTNLDEIKAELIRTKSILAALIGILEKDSLYEKLNSKNRHENTVLALINFFKAISQKKPIILILEDSHWIDESSIDFLKKFEKEIKGFPIHFLASSRFNDDGSKPVLDLDISTKELSLNEISKEFAQEFITALLGSKINRKLVNFIYEKTQGNPFYLEQITLYLKENKFITLQDGVWNLINSEFELPLSVKNVITARIDRLSNDLKETVQNACVLGREFETEVLFRMLKTYKLPQEKSIYLESCEEQKIWSAISELKYLFRHALLRDSVYEMQVYSRLKTLHKLAAESILELFPNDKNRYTDLVFHFEQADEKEPLIKFLELAGDFSTETYENNKALEFYEKLLKLIENQKDKTLMKIDTNFKIFEILSNLGKWDIANKVIDLCLKLSIEARNSERILKSKFFNAQGFILRGNYPEAFKILEKLLSEKISQKAYDESYAEILSKLGLVYYHLGKKKELQKSLETLITFSKKEKLSLFLMNAYWLSAQICMDKKEDNKAIKFYEKSLEVAKKNDNLYGIGAALRGIGTAYTFNGKFEIAKEKYEEFESLMRITGNQRVLASVLPSIGILHESLGEYDEALKVHEKHLKINEKLGDFKGLAVSYTNFCSVYFLKEDLDNSIKYYQKALALHKKSGYFNGQIELHQIALRIYFRRNEFKELETLCKNSLLQLKSMNSDFCKEFFEIFEDFAKFNKDNSESEKALRNILKITEESDSLNIKAELNHLLFLSFKRKKDQTLTEKFRKIALEQYKILSKNNPNFLLKTTIQELEN